MAPTKTLQFDRVYNKAGCPWEDCLRLGTSNCTLLFRATALYCSVFPMHCYIWIIFAQFETNHILIYRHKTPNMNTFFIIVEPWLDLNNVRVLCCKSGLIVADMQFLIRKEISFVTLITFVFSPTVKKMMWLSFGSGSCDIKQLREKFTVTYEKDNIWFKWRGFINCAVLTERTDHESLKSVLK